MHLVLASNDKTVATIPIDPSRYTDNDYISAMRRLLSIKHRHALRTLQQPIVCYLTLPSRMKQRRKGSKQQTTSKS